MSRPDIVLYTANTMNGWKPLIFLHEAEIDYDLDRVAGQLWPALHGFAQTLILDSLLGPRRLLFGERHADHLHAVARAILTDPEAIAVGDASYGKLREPIVRLAHLWRAFDASDPQGGLNEYQVINAPSLSQKFGQSPLFSPSVFNFFRPDYERAGPLANAGLAAPEFQITNESTLVLTANLLERLAYGFIDSDGIPRYNLNGFNAGQRNGVELRTAAWEGFSDDPAMLIDKLGLVFMQGRMGAQMRQDLINYIEQIPPTETAYRGVRVVEATSAIINSPQYSVQR